MAATEDLINFDIIESQKENIQSLPGGRSAKKLADLFSPAPLHKLATPTPSDTKNINDCIRAEYEAELASLVESDDPLDVFDRYVRWTLDAYPSAQATPQSQLHTLLERATKTFINSPQYKNDPRYLKLWLHYIHFFSDAPRETFMYLSRHNVGDTLALFYEEYAAWLEGAGRWTQAEEVYKLGIEREARPVQRLLRKCKEFEDRFAQQPDTSDAPSSPALPTVRPALAAKIDPFATSSQPLDPQAPRSGNGIGGQSKPPRAKLAIFSDAGDAAPAMASRGAGSKGWESIGSLAERKKENVMEPKPWAGETLRAGGKKAAGPKMAVFKDKSLLSQISHFVVSSTEHQVTVNPNSGKKERVFVDLATLYPTPDETGTELSFEEVWAGNRGWLDGPQDGESIGENSSLILVDTGPAPDDLVREVAKLVIQHDTVLLDENGAIKESHRPGKSKKLKVMEVNETQIIKAKLDSPSRPKIRKKNSAEPTMTIHTKAATDEIYEIFNQPPPSSTLQEEEDEETVDEEDYETDGDYTSGAESTGTTRQISTSEVGDDETSEKTGSEWSDFSARKHIPHVQADAIETEPDDTDVSDLIDTSDPEAGTSGQVAGGTGIEDDDKLVTPINESAPRPRTTFVPIPPEDYEPPTRPYRDPAEVANNRLPFMTPITERTETSLELLTTGRMEHCKTPSRRHDISASEGDSTGEPLSSPLLEIVNESRPPRISQPALQKAITTPSTKSTGAKQGPPKGPLIKDAQCNPMDESVRNDILTNMQPPLDSYTGFYDHRDESYGKGADIRKFIKATTKAAKSGGEKTTTVSAPIIQLAGVETEYTVKLELGAGAFAPVYLVENSSPDEVEGPDGVVAMGKGAFAVSHRAPFEALKMEQPPTPWEFHIMRVAHSRLGPQHRAAASLSYPHELHLYKDEGFLFLPYHPHGTLLDVVNHFRAEPAGVMDEQLAMFFAVELLRTLEALHAKSVMHGDLKPDNCLLRLDTSAGDAPLASQYKPDGSGGWAARGVILIDLGRGVDMRCFVPDVQFIADWDTSPQDCAEMREGRPWTWQLDYFGLAGILHCLLFGRYIETVRCDLGGLGAGGRRYKVRESLKRYWQVDIWAECFDLLLNPGAFADREEGGRMPVLRSLRKVREQMEEWLKENCEKGVGLKALLAKVEGFAKGRK